MAGRSRSTKKLAQRIDLNYFKRVYPIPRWQRNLSLGFLGIAALWLGWDALAGKQRAFSAGPLAHSHTLLTNNCAACHVNRASVGRKVTDAACLACHDGPIHNAEQISTPACADCHAEHKGSARLASVRSEACAGCHADLKTKTGRTTFATNVGSFESAHPEFAALRNRDPGTIRMSHQVHMAENLRGPRGAVHLTCSDCHARDQGQMLRIDYAKHCAACHPLIIDPRIPEPVPHDKPRVVADFVAQYALQHPQSPRPAQLAWKTCDQCHTMTLTNPAALANPAALPEIAPSQIPARWFRHALFDHDVHQMLVCTECHARALTSTVSSDVLIPGIDTCRKCHQGSADAADSNCSECHNYHDWTKAKKVDGKLTISNFR
jgi:hypothetical protein